MGTLSGRWGSGRFGFSGGFGSRSGVAATLLIGHGLDRAGEHRRRFGQHAGQHAERLLEGRQRGQHFDVRGAVLLAFDDDRAHAA